MNPDSFGIFFIPFLNKQRMKYCRLTKEQFEALHQEFSNFLATQSIDKAEWDQLKADKPELAESELDVFSDLIWEGVLSKATFLEHFSKNHIFLFHCTATAIESIIITSLNSTIDLMTFEGIEWLENHLLSDEVEIRTGTKTYTEERNSAIFELIRQGAILGEGQLYQQIHEAINTKI